MPSPLFFDLILSNFNKKKSASLYFISKMLKGAHLPNVYLNGVLVKQVDTVKYLGHFLTCELSDDIDIRRQCRVLNVRGNILSRKFHMCSEPVKLKLFNSYCASLYTPHLWWNYKKMSVTKLHITYHNILKRNIGLSKYESTSATCADTNTQCCKSTIRNLVFKFVCRLNRPLSRRLDRCDCMIQNEGHDSRKLFTLKKALCR